MPKALLNFDAIPCRLGGGVRAAGTELRRGEGASLTKVLYLGGDEARARGKRRSKIDLGGGVVEGARPSALNRVR